MEEILTRMWHDLSSRPDGPLAMRFYLQPAMALLFAIRDGIKDAKNGQSPYFWAIFTHPEQRRDLIQDGWKSIMKIVIAALLLDTVYQFLVLKQFYPMETLIVVTWLAVFPYVATRGPINRLMRHRYQNLKSTLKSSKDKAA